MAHESPILIFLQYVFIGCQATGVLIAAARQHHAARRKAARTPCGLAGEAIEGEVCIDPWRAHLGKVPPITILIQ
jgi:hypothetical protein